jgi:peptidoglycan/xylan/chitin deacetylase (PgdA/CDA1 family)
MRNTRQYAALAIAAGVLSFSISCQQSGGTMSSRKSPPPLLVGTGYAHTDALAPSAQPPAGLPVDKVPMFVAMGFDDNGLSGLDGSTAPGGGLSAICDIFANRRNPAGKGNGQTYDGTPAHFTFYAAANYICCTDQESPVFNKRVWHQAVAQGNEIGNHTYSHNHGNQFAPARWKSELLAAIEWYCKPFDPSEEPESPDLRCGIGLQPSQLFGFRTPYLEYNDSVLAAIKAVGFEYDCSIEEGFQDDQDGTNFLWPYTLDNGSPGNAKTTADSASQPVGKHPGLWEMPVYAATVPPDSLCGRYGVKPGLRQKMAKVRDYFAADNGKLTGIDWNLWVDFGMTKAEFLATVKYSFDLRLAGNRCPFLFGTHSDIYSEAYPDSMPNSTAKERREALGEFLDYALSKPETRVVTVKNVLDWMRKPAAL